MPKGSSFSIRDVHRQQQQQQPDAAAAQLPLPGTARARLQAEGGAEDLWGLFGLPG